MNVGRVLTGLLAITFSTLGFAEPSEVQVTPSASAPRVLLTDGAHTGERFIGVGRYGVIVASPDGKTWVQEASPTRNLLTSVYFVDNEHGWAGGHDAIILHTSDGGRRWMPQHEAKLIDDIPKPVLDIYFKNKRAGVAVGGFALVLATEDGGAHWRYEDTTDLYQLLEAQDMEPSPMLNAIEEFGDGYLIVGERGTVLVYQPDGGGAGSGGAVDEDPTSRATALDEDGISKVEVSRWSLLQFPYDGTLFGANTRLSFGGLMVYGLRGHIFVSSDNGESWSQIDTGGVIANIFDTVELSDGTVIAVGGSGTVLRIPRGGSVAEVVRYPAYDDLLAAEYVNDDELLLFGSAGPRCFRLDLSDFCESGFRDGH